MDFVALLFPGWNKPRVKGVKEEEITWRENAMTTRDFDSISPKRATYTQPFINVTPLIDVLLVLLIIFMVITPIKPARFQAQVPGEPQPDAPINAHPHTLVVSIANDMSLKINEKIEAGNVFDTQPLADKLARTFAERKANGAWREDALLRDDLTPDERVERKVFIKAPRSIEYSNVVKVIDAAKGAGAQPIGLQIDDLAQ